MLVSILITFLVVILVLYLINLLPLDGRAKQIARVVVIIVLPPAGHGLQASAETGPASLPGLSALFPHNVHKR